MAVTPTGSPAWTRTVDFTHYGGHADKENYLGRGAIDALTDVAAEEYSRLAADTAAAVRTAAFAVMGVTCNDTSPAAPTVTHALMMTGVRLTSYASGSPPSGFPSGARNGDGDVTFTFSSSYLDEYGVSGGFTPRSALATSQTANANAVAVVIGQTVQVVVTDDTDFPVADASFSLVVW
ncbi:MAG TPA: hypothetical protein VFR23_24660 [Jiangellaceae bacterium]|nr:hypothetical protein [Jiangellaceae bacterium]